MKTWCAEVIAIGDELVSGQRLDTNTQWVSQQLGQLGIRTTFHSTVGDDLAQNQAVLDAAIQRADIVVCSGGLGPTADDLTREVIAAAAGVPLVRDPSVVEHIRGMYARRNIEMPETNLCQADFPRGATIVPNPEGTAPGIDLAIPHATNPCRVFALPGVPAELKQMWAATVHPTLLRLTGSPAVLRYRTLHVFGEGESKVETMLPDLVRRGNDPITGITASAATITLRVSTAGATEVECDAKIEPILKTIRECLGDLIFGADGQSLADVVVEQLQHQRQTLAIVDYGLHGEVATAIAAADANRSVLLNASLPAPAAITAPLRALAQEARQQAKTDYAIAISPVNRDADRVAAGESKFQVTIVGTSPGNATDHAFEEYTFRGHSSWRQQRAVKQVLNQFRKFIQAT